jgi:preprotein translocase SecE subunit
MADVIQEYRKVHWPTQREYVGGTVGVLVVVGVVTVVLGVVDFGLNQILRLVLP